MTFSQARRRSLLALSAGIGISLQGFQSPVHAAKDVALVSGAFRRSIPVRDFEHLAETGEATGLLGNLLDLSGQDPMEVSKLLNQS